jgi:PAS domain S-box-containing protein
MSIRAKLTVNAAITIALALLVALTVVVSSRNVEQATRNDRFAFAVVNDVSDLNSLSYAYLLLRDKRPRVQWQLKHASLERLLSEHAVVSLEERVLLDRLRSNHEQLKRLFDVVSARVEESRPGAGNASSAYDELNEGVTAQLMARAEMMANDASLLGREAGRRMDAVRQASVILIVGSALLLILSAAMTAFFLIKSIGGSILVLERGTQRIAGGDLGYRVPVAGTDEISRLSAAFNDMTAKLADSYSTLEERVEQRTAELAQRTAELDAVNQTLRESEERWATTLASIGDAVIATDVEGKIAFMNAVAEGLTGWKLRDALAMPVSAVFNIVNEQTRSAVESPVAKVLREGMVVGLANHTILIRKDGKEVPIDDSGAPIRHVDGTTTGVVLVFRDITDRKQAEEELRKSRDELELRVAERTEELRKASAYNRNLIEASIDPLVTIDHEGRISDVNLATEQSTGYSRHELIGTDFSDYFTDPQEARAGYRMVFNEGFVHDYPLEIRHRDGHITPVLYNASVYRDDTGSVIGVFAAARNVSEQQKLEAQLRQAQKMEALGTMSGGIAHDFNNILAAIIGFTELIGGHVSKGSRDERHVARIMQAGIRGRELVRQMLTFSRKTEQEKKPLRLSGIVAETVKLIRATIPATISIRVKTLSESGLILADPTQMQQVLMNLCTNAAYAMREKGGILDIALSDYSVSPSDDDPHGIAPGLYMKLSVRDTGIGMSREIMDKIFDPFFTTKTVGEGSGLGLSVVHGIVKQHEGCILVESEPDKGSTFTVYLPRIAGELQTDTACDDEIPTGSERILFVDDEEALVEMGEDILAELGYEVTSRMSSREALALFRLDPSRFDLVITDQTMPEMTGVELAGEILAIRADIPIIMCTGFSHLVDADKAKATGIKAFAMKPLTKREIATTIRKVLDE